MGPGYRGPVMATRRRGSRWPALLVGVPVAALLLGACVQLPPLPPPPPAPFVSQYCAPTIPSSPSDYQSAFDEVRRVGTEWAGSDGGFPTTLPDGRVLWLYGDTLAGRIQSDGSLAPGFRQPRNSFILQSGACFTPMMGGSANARTDIIPSPANEWYWPTGGVVEPGPTPGSSVLRVFVYHEAQTNQAPPFDFQLLDMKIATFSLPDLTFQGVQPLPDSIPSGDQNPWGQSTLIAGGWVYVFERGTTPGDTGPDAGRDHRVARVALGSLTTGPWQFYNGGTSGTDADWTPNDPTAAIKLAFSATTPALPSDAQSAKPLDPLFVVPDPAGGYLAVGKLGEGSVPAFGADISGWTAPAPQGPWHYAGNVATASTVANQITYGAHLVLDLPGGAPSVMYSINSLTTGAVTNNVFLYGVRLVAPDIVP